MNLPYAILFHSVMYVSMLQLSAFGLEESAVTLLAGAVAAAVSCVVGVPLEAFKHRMQVHGKGYGTSRQAVLSGMQRPRELYAGVYTTLLRNVPYNAVQWGTYAFLLRLSAPPFLAGACAGIATALVTTPIDVVNTRLQTQAVLSSGLAEEGGALYRGPVDAVRRMLHEEGAGAFWRGGGARAAGYAPSALVFFAVYGSMRQWIAGS
jgi:hypothetical protein